MHLLAFSLSGGMQLAATPSLQTMFTTEDGLLLAVGPLVASYPSQIVSEQPIIGHRPRRDACHPGPAV